MPKLKTTFGFTLIELMVAITIVAIIATIGAIVYSQAQNSGKIAKRRQDLIAINQALELFKNSTGKYPIQTGSFVCAASLISPNSLTPTYMRVIPTDPAGNPTDSATCYQYRSDASGTEYKLRTNPGLAASGEMTAADFLQQPSLIDPALDGVGGGSNLCAVDASAPSAWALYASDNCPTCACAYN